MGWRGINAFFEDLPLRRDSCALLNERFFSLIDLGLFFSFGFIYLGDAVFFWGGIGDASGRFFFSSGVRGVSFVSFRFDVDFFGELARTLERLCFNLCCSFLIGIQFKKIIFNLIECLLLMEKFVLKEY